MLLNPQNGKPISVPPISYSAGITQSIDLYQYPSRMALYPPGDYWVLNLKDWQTTTIGQSLPEATDVRQVSRRMPAGYMWLQQHLCESLVDGK